MIRAYILVSGIIFISDLTMTSAIHELAGLRKAEFKEKYIEHYKYLCKEAGTDYNKFIEYSLKFPRRSIRVNTLKISVAGLKKRLSSQWLLDKIPWCNEGFWIEHKGIIIDGEEQKRRDTGNLLEHSLGYFYIQEASSMIPAIILAPKPGEIVLDMCASPGSKATQIAQYMKNKGLLIANDYKADRMSPLSINLQRCGVSNCIQTLMQGHWFSSFGEVFDKVLLDAPCSGTGTIRKSIKTLQLWNPVMIRRLAGMQKQLILAAYSCLKPGGALVYSTCSVEPEENEAVISYFLEQRPDAKIMPINAANLRINKGSAVLEFKGNNYSQYSSQLKNCIRIWPQDNDTDGFFVAKIKKQ